MATETCIYTISIYEGQPVADLIQYFEMLESFLRNIPGAEIRLHDSAWRNHWAGMYIRIPRDHERARYEEYYIDFAQEVGEIADHLTRFPDFLPDPEEEDPDELSFYPSLRINASFVRSPNVDTRSITRSFIQVLVTFPEDMYEY
jgi:hypothetical protein